MFRCCSYFLVLWAWVLVSVLVQASVVFTIPDESLVKGLVAGQAFELSWKDADGAVGIFLVNGVTGAIAGVVGFDLTDQTSLMWTPATSLPNTIYKFEIGDTQAPPAYSNMFNLTGGGVVRNSRTTSSTSTSTTSASQKSSKLFPSSSSSDTLPTSTSSSLSHQHTHSGSWTRTYTGAGLTRTSHSPRPRTTTTSCSASSCTTLVLIATRSVPPPPPPRCSTTCLRNLNGTRVTHTANSEKAAATSTVTSANAVTKSTKNAELSASARVAIGIGAAVGVAIVAVLLVLTFWQGRMSGQASVVRGTEVDADGRYVMHGAVGEIVEEKPPVEMDAGYGLSVEEINARRRQWDARGNG